MPARPAKEYPLSFVSPRRRATGLRRVRQRALDLLLRDRDGNRRGQGREAVNCAFKLMNEYSAVDRRLLLTGPAGTGKTRLAVAGLRGLNERDSPAEETLEDRSGVRLKSRLYGVCRTVIVEGEDYRRKPDAKL